MIKPTCERQQISFLEHSRFNQVKCLWFEFMITFIRCIIRLSNLFNIAIQLLGIPFGLLESTKYV